MPRFSRLIRFIAADGKTYYGDAILPPGISDLSRVAEARVIEGDILSQGYRVTDQILDVNKLLAPFAPKDTKTVRCLGLNYAQHAKESNMDIPKFPVLFYKPNTSLSGPSDPIPIPKAAQDEPGLDYECELVVVIGKEARDVSEDSALDYVLGYCAGNDISHRDWQLKKGGGQWSLGKGFDGWAPIGPAIISPSLIPDPQKLRIFTKVNGQAVQDSSTADMIFSVAKTLSFLSQGTTLLPGDFVFTGTPPGVGMGRRPQYWLNDGDIVEVGIEGIGSITNKVMFERTKPRL
ncbi:hypothetical protein C7212DRAFT_279058 [Tuber magnatum]|uniref:Fumarylacetoacetase-like C-terminal domain-containing protein n=1 Tax=Tuber magnatum TaxID=42249 RepID=A0A317SRD1_9PEZI|nr:hypothetical protein C7212DRAFT_279058 [Tuber magnatum]